MPDTAEVTPLSTVHDDAWSAPPQDDKLRIFISHKLADGQVAKVVKDSLRLIGGPRTEISVSEDIGFGDDWVEQIHHQLSMSDWLFLLYTDPSMGWDWCLYETGFFRGKTDKKDRLIVIHNPNTDIPNVLTRWKSVPATPPAINELVQQVFSEEPRTHVPPIRDDLGGLDELLRPTIERIVGELGDSTKTYWYTNYLSILLSPQQLDAFVAGNQIPDDAHVDGDAGSLALFGLTKSKNHDYSWKHLLEELDSPEQKAWIEDLAPQLRRDLDDR
nr:hypothetical protein [Gammaproteobacteria bacterium]NIR85105.1 hypothetical protein [Gammaproteobacteria bacterium]NIR92015.1 hypothetical protein [Gammaproteobacteria bacterium]NIU06154.1 hypothetical protein [Gammaproteobacteria bacterium]NIV53097.1 hypothetical protein [Gammaproteobacteria bacterium]